MTVHLRRLSHAESTSLFPDIAHDLEARERAQALLKMYASVDARERRAQRRARSRVAPSLDYAALQALMAEQITSLDVQVGDTIELHSEVPDALFFRALQGALRQHNLAPRQYQRRGPLIYIHLRRPQSQRIPRHPTTPGSGYGVNNA